MAMATTARALSGFWGMHDGEVNGGIGWTIVNLLALLAAKHKRWIPAFAVMTGRKLF
ncbi:MAG: hypothetical protein OXF25_05165 [Cyanobacteria bacterium MAG CAR3_bin_5]|nr:hypothetical protein [Cyanobacteria bacterium MAG CAR3_bin_5]